MLLSEVEYAAFLSYSPRGSSAAAQESRTWCRALKDESYVGQPPAAMSRFVARRLVARRLELPFNGWFGPGVMLVPVPKSSLMGRGDLWVPGLLATAFVEVGLAADVLPCLVRRHAVRKSATSPAGERASPMEHYESLRVDRTFPEPKELLLVDDVVTRGATMLAAASRMREAYPTASIRAFAVIRTISNADEFVGMLEPVTGHIRMRGENPFRDP
jgi:hypothetical protein